MLDGHGLLVQEADQVLVDLKADEGQLGGAIAGHVGPESQDEPPGEVEDVLVRLEWWTIFSWFIVLLRFLLIIKIYFLDVVPAKPLFMSTFKSIRVLLEILLVIKLCEVHLLCFGNLCGHSFIIKASNPLCQNKLLNLVCNLLSNFHLLRVVAIDN